MPENIFLQSGDMDKVEKLSRQKVVSLSLFKFYNRILSTTLHLFQLKEISLATKEKY